MWGNDRVPSSRWATGTVRQTVYTNKRALPFGTNSETSPDHILQRAVSVH
uniref:Uncharacterized protein n=1 Tax=Anguilla anguilla TaxID=7936 RepID=A0A0E9TCI1_ANGAN